VFTGLVEETGRVLEVREEPGGLRLRIGARTVLEDLRTGDSLMVDGVCLTVVARDEGGAEVEAIPETLRASTLGERRPGDEVNLERALVAGGRLGGHIVQGHVDGVGVVAAAEPWGNSTLLAVQAPDPVLTYVVPKGSVAVDGISLTVVDRIPGGFRVAIIPHTAAATTFGALRPGRRVNLEADVVAKYVAQLVEPYAHAEDGGGRS
jgi:riboflavin synthase